MTKKMKKILSYLAKNPGSRSSWIADELWPGQGQETNVSKLMGRLENLGLIDNENRLTKKGWGLESEGN